MQIERLCIHKLKHIALGTDLEFGDGINVVLGKNGTGKTTLLKLLTHVARLDFSPYLREACDLEARLRFGETVVEVRFVVASPEQSVSPAALPDVLGHSRQPLSRSIDRWKLTGALKRVGVENPMSFHFDSHGRREVSTAGVPSPAVFADAQMSRSFGRDLMLGVMLTHAKPPNNLRTSNQFNAILEMGETCRFDEALGAWDAIVWPQRIESSDSPLVSSVTTESGLDTSGAIYADSSSQMVPYSLIPSDDSASAIDAQLSTGISIELPSLSHTLNVRKIHGTPRLVSKVTEEDEVITTYSGLDFRIDLD